MSGDKYLISDQHATYFLTFTVVRWIDVFSRQEYRNILVDSLNYCAREKGLTVFAWVIMTNHVHLVATCRVPHRMSDFLRDFKKFSSKQIVEAIHAIPESRRSWLLDAFGFEAKRTGRAQEFKLWKDDNHAIDLTHSNVDPMEKVRYIHENPIRAGIVVEADHYIYSSAIDYAQGKGLVAVEVL
jgi:REP element-mobilizing transposase RayT